jgi:APA family basic amino acid/polyamine antiporter
VLLFLTERELFSGRRLVVDTLVASLGFAYAGWAMWGTGQEAVSGGVFLLLGGIPVYAAMKWWQRREADRALLAPTAYRAPDIRATVAPRGR